MTRRWLSLILLLGLGACNAHLDNFHGVSTLGLVAPPGAARNSGAVHAAMTGSVALDDEFEDPNWLVPTSSDTWWFFSSNLNCSR